MAYDVFISYSRADLQWVERLAWRLRSSGLSVWLDVWFIRPGDSISTEIDKALAESQTAIVVYSQASTKSPWVQQEEAAAYHAFVTAQRFPDNQKRLIPVKLEECKIPPLANSLAAVDFTGIDPQSAEYESRVRELLRAFSNRLLSLQHEPIGVPLVIVSLKDSEVHDLFSGQAFVDGDVSWQPQFEQFVGELRNAMRLPPDEPLTTLRDRLLAQYGTRREDWHPYGSDRTILEVIEKRFDDFNSALNPQLRHPIFPDLWSEEFFAPQVAVRTQAFLSLARRGCYLLVDPLALFHPRVVRVLGASQLLLSDAVTILCASPLNLRVLPVFQLFEQAVERNLEALFGRFVQIDPQCVLGAEDPFKLELWLKTQLPTTVERLKGESPYRENVEMLRSVVETKANGIGALIVSPT
jgi:TIR domain-containing protein